ncbi:DUF3012 domain-containing protein [Teredinibacter haidensis]|uniref:DUF3012 domain-containing protein n=1 Tax=Teredinibacter haidensis TaxID=2731755 RepID=UPI0009F99A0A|nr:DUF3012 domain-containing protein [Teredinibacter haidensis]
MSKKLLYGFVVTTFLLCGCAEKKMTEEWCEEMMIKPNKEWTEKDAQLFARDCLTE